MLDTVISRHPYITDAVVFAAMLSVAAAVGIALVLEAGIAPTIAASFAIMGYIAAAGGHILLRKTQKLKRLQAELGAARDAGDAVSQDARGAVDGFSVLQKALSGSKERRHGAAIRKDIFAGRVDAAVAGAPRLPIEPPKPFAAAHRSAPVGRKPDIENIIRRLEDDIKSGRKLQEGVCIARPHSAANTLHATVCEEEKSVLSNDASNNLQSPSPAWQSSRISQKPDAADKLAAIADALVREQLDVFLEPIHGLNDGRESHFEVSIGLHPADGEIVDREDYLEIARGAALLPLIDAVKVSQAKKVALHLMQRGRDGTFISRIDGQSVSAGQSFSDDLASIMGQNAALMAGRLVLSITQDDVRIFSSAQWATVNRLKQLGFRFAIAEVNSLDIDFEMLAQRGFVFAKLDATVFLEGLPAAQTLIPPTDVCRYLTGTGLTLIVDGLIDEAQKAKVLGFGAVYGQGMLFGAPRPFKVQAIDMPTEAEALSHRSAPV